MADAIISAVLEAQVTNFRTGLQSAAAELNRTGAAAQNASNTISQNIARVNNINLRTFQSSLRAGQVTIAQTAASARTLAPALANAGNSARSSGIMYMNLGRVLQDLPYGFTAIQNNLTQLIPAAGLAGLAFTAIVSAVTFATVGTGAWTRGLDSNAKALKNSKKASDEYLESLNQLDQVQLKGAQNAQKEVTELTSLYKVATDTSISIRERRDAVNELQEQYPKYFKNLQDETILNGGAKAAYDSLTLAIIATGRARAAQDLITKNSSRQLEDEQKLIDLEKVKLKQINEVRKARELEAASNMGTSSLSAGGGSITAAKKVYDATKLLEDTQTQINNLKTDSNILTERNLQLTKAITAEVKKGADLSGSVGGLDTAKVPKDNKVRELKDPTKFKFNDFGKYAISTFNKLRGTISEEEQKLLRDQEDFNEKLSGILNVGLVGTFAGIGDAIGTALADGTSVVDALGKSLLGSLGGVLTQLGEMAIGVGIGLQAIKTALESLNPVVAIAAGVALLALGSFVSGKAKGIGGGIKGNSNNITAFANGGIVYGPTNALIGEYSGARNNPEVVAPLSKLKSMLSSGGPSNWQIIPIVDNKGLAIQVRKGQSQLNRS